MARRTLISMLALCAMASSALAQPAPFDMSPESNLVVPQAVPETGIAAPVETVPQVPVATTFERHLLTNAAVQLAGEESRHAAYFYLTEKQAAAGARLQVSYLNSLVVAPEFSSLRLLVNGTEVASTPIMSSAEPGLVEGAIPAGLLRSGANSVEFRARQRHRTDCSVASTYELWSQIESANVRLLLEGQDLGVLTRLADLAALGVSSQGTSTLRILGDGTGTPEATSTLLHLVQQITLGWRVAELQVEQVATPSAAFEEGVLDLVVAPASLLPEQFAALRSQAEQAPLAVLLPSATGANTLVVSAPDWSGIARAGEAILAAAPAQGRARIDIGYPHPLLEGGSEVSLASLGLATAEFNGRRYNDRVSFDLPADFYAYRYGELDLVLDAAYSADVLPGSEIDVYINGQIASATPLLRTDGGTLRDSVIRIPMTHLQPGRNLVDLAVNLQAQSDLACSPGWTGEAPVRFVFSDTSRLRLPDYARAVAVPDLQVLSGSGWPYVDGAPVPLALGRDSASLVAAMTLLSRIAASSGKVIPVSIVDESRLDPAADALLIMPYPAMSQPILARAGLTGSSSASGDGGALDRFGGETANPVKWLTDWLGDGIGLKPEDLRLLPAGDSGYVPPSGSTALSQSRQPEGGIWTVLTAPDGQTLVGGTQRLTQTANWRAVGGRVTALGARDEQPMVIPANTLHLVETQPMSVANLRLVAANWFSGNILFYAGLIAVAGIVLMLATSFVLARAGRHQ